MKQLLIIAGMSVIFSAHANTQTETAKSEKIAAVTEAKMITKAFGSELKKALTAAMKSGGPINALDVCNTKAMPITKQAAIDHNALVTRVSLKNRNPENIPNEWQTLVLEDFDERAVKGEDIQKMGYSKIVEKDGKKTLRFMKALPTGAACLTCHGSHIGQDVQAKLKELYPNDKAVGYEKGQVRGAVVVIKALD